MIKETDGAASSLKAHSVVKKWLRRNVYFDYYLVIQVMRFAGGLLCLFTRRIFTLYLIYLLKLMSTRSLLQLKLMHSSLSAMPTTQDYSTFNLQWYKC